MTRALIVMMALFGASLAAACAGTSEARTTIAPIPGPDVQGGEWFRKTGCTDCHSMSVYRILNVTAVGPDLSIAVEDVPRRFGVSLDQFFQAPTGTMSMVLSSRIPLTTEQRRLAVERLKEAYRDHQEAAAVVRPIASH